MDRIVTMENMETWTGGQKCVMAVQTVHIWHDRLKGLAETGADGDDVMVNAFSMYGLYQDATLCGAELPAGQDAAHE